MSRWRSEGPGLAPPGICTLFIGSGVLGPHPAVIRPQSWHCAQGPYVMLRTKPWSTISKLITLPATLTSLVQRVYTLGLNKPRAPAIAFLRFGLLTWKLVLWQPLIYLRGWDPLGSKAWASRLPLLVLMEICWPIYADRNHKDLEGRFPSPS